VEAVAGYQVVIAGFGCTGTRFIIQRRELARRMPGFMRFAAECILTYSVVVCAQYQPMRVLVIEDEIEIASFIVGGLRADRFVVDIADDGAKGFQMARLNDYDLLVVDIMLPGKDGIELCKELRALGKTCALIMLSAKNDIYTKVEALNSGADDYVTKPFSFEELRARVHALLRRERKLHSSQLTVGDLVMDTLTHTVTRRGKKIELSKKEFILLEYFMRNAGLTLTRAMILEHVWDMNADPFTNTVDVHIRFLREKIDRPFRRKLLHTVHGYGYKLEQV